jgi:hypothetical protein
MWLARGDRDGARALLLPLLDSFKPGHRDTRDLAEARAIVGA